MQAAMDRFNRPRVAPTARDSSLAERQNAKEVHAALAWLAAFDKEHPGLEKTITSAMHARNRAHQNRADHAACYAKLLALESAIQADAPPDEHAERLRTLKLLQSLAPDEYAKMSGTYTPAQRKAASRKRKADIYDVGKDEMKRRKRLVCGESDDYGDDEKVDEAVRPRRKDRSLDAAIDAAKNAAEPGAEPMEDDDDEPVEEDDEEDGDVMAGLNKGVVGMAIGARPPVSAR